MVKLDKIYTRGGDKGDTSLGDGHRVPKDDLRVIAMGSVDELNASIGIALLHIPDSYQDISGQLSHIQNDLFDCGADLCMPENKIYDYPVLRMIPQQTTQIEQWIDGWNKHLKPLTSFILPSGSPASSYLHLARTLARRSERDCVHLMKSDFCAFNISIITYLNRLSDCLFVIGRILNNNGQDDILWVPAQNRNVDKPTHHQDS